jgi:hypothetical protein
MSVLKKMFKAQLNVVLALGQRLFVIRTVQYCTSQVTFRAVLVLSLQLIHWQFQSEENSRLFMKMLARLKLF